MRVEELNEPETFLEEHRGAREPRGWPMGQPSLQIIRGKPVENLAKLGRFVTS